MVTINYCPSCGKKLDEGSFKCAHCYFDFTDLLNNSHPLKINDVDHTIELYEGSDEEYFEAPIFEVGGDDENNIEIVLDDGDFIGEDGMPKEIPIEIFVDDDEDIEIEFNVEGDDSNIIIEDVGDGNFVIKPKIEFQCPVCGATVGEDMVCKSCFTSFMLSPDESNNNK